MVRYWALILTPVSLLLTPAFSQIVTPRGKMAAVYQQADIESTIISEVEPDGRWRLDFTGAEIPGRLPDESAAYTLRFLLPGRDTGFVLLARVKGPGRRNEGWVNPETVEISPDPAWKIPPDTLMFVPMKARHIPPLKAASLPAGVPAKSASYLLLVDPEGKVLKVRSLDVSDPAIHPNAQNTRAGDPVMDDAMKQFRFAPVRVEGDPVHLLMAIRIEPKR